MHTRGAENFDHYGRETTRLVNETFDSGVSRAVLLMRHSARTFTPGIHDMENLLTDHGRGLSRRMGQEMLNRLSVRGYASPVDRCLETAQLVIEGHVETGGQGHRTRPVEALGVFYALDQQKMWKGMSQADSMVDYIDQWFDGAVPPDALMPAELAVQMVVRALLGKLSGPMPEHPAGQGHLDLCVSHDFTVFAVRHGLGLEPLDGPEVEFLDGLLLFEREGEHFMRSQHGSEVKITT